MTTQTFKGKKIQELMDEIEHKYQNNYRILQQKEKMRNPLLFWLKKYEVEIEVLEELEREVEVTEKQNQPLKKQTTSDFNEKKKKLLDMLEEPQENSKQETLQNNQNNHMEMMQKMMEQMMQKMEETKKETPVVPKEKEYLADENEFVLRMYYEKMVEAEVKNEIARLIIDEVKKNLLNENWLDEKEVENAILHQMTEIIQVIETLSLEKTKVIALIGPTGVGKTTTIAKLAGYMTDKQKKVGLITTDVFRIGATDQLQIYANILDSEMIAVNSPEELEAAIEKLTYEYKVDQILIDTVGRSPLDVDSIDDVKDYLRIAKPDHVGLVLSSTQKSKDVKKILENFEKVTIHSLLFTKLDETLNHGIMINATVDGQIPISYITNGQNVPYDIYQADAHAIAKKILNGVDEFGSSIFSA